MNIDLALGITPNTPEDTFELCGVAFIARVQRTGKPVLIVSHSNEVVRKAVMLLFEALHVPDMWTGYPCPEELLEPETQNPY